MADQVQALLEFPVPEAAAGSAKVDAEALKGHLKRLVPFITRTTPAALGHIWVYAQDGALVALASDLAATGQIDMREVHGGQLPLVGITSADAKDLIRVLAKPKGFVTLRTAGAQLAVADGPDDIARTDIRVPTPVDRDVLDQIGRHLADARAACEDSDLPYGTASFSPAKEALFGPAVGRRWFTPSGKTYIEVDPHFRGYIAAVRPIPLGARRPLPAGQVRPAIPTERTAA